MTKHLFLWLIIEIHLFVDSITYRYRHRYFSLIGFSTTFLLAKIDQE